MKEWLKYVLPKWLVFKQEHDNQHLCACGCGKFIEIKPSQIHNGVPKYIVGHNGRGIKMPPRTEEWTRHASESHKGNPGYWTGKKRPNLSGENHFFYGKHRSEKTKQKISQSLMGCPNYATRGRSPSIETRQKLREANLGAKSNFWRGGTMSEDSLWRGHYKYNVWKRAVKQRDNYTCQLCGRDGCMTHHIRNFRRYPDLRYDVDNGILLCRRCHGRITPHEEDYIWLFDMMVCGQLVINWGIVYRTKGENR